MGTYGVGAVGTYGGGAVGTYGGGVIPLTRTRQMSYNHTKVLCSYGEINGHESCGL